MSKPNLDRSGRTRSKMIGFRVSDEEARLIDIEVMLSGMNKQDYIVSRLLKREITVKPSLGWYSSVRKAIQSIYEELQRLESASEGSQELWEAIDALSEEFVALRGSDAPMAEIEAAPESWYVDRKYEDAPIREESRAPIADRTAHQIISHPHSIRRNRKN